MKQSKKFESLFFESDENEVLKIRFTTSNTRVHLAESLTFSALH